MRLSIQRKERGFTLIELVIVIVIIGILAAAAMSKYVDLSGNAQTSANLGSLDEVSTAFNLQIGANAAANPTNPFPTLAALVAGMRNGAQASDHTGVCIGNHYKVVTYTDAAGTTATAAATDQVKSFATTAPAADAAHC